MSVQSDISSIQYTGNGSAVTPYPVPFVFHEATHVRAVVIAENGAQTDLVLGTDYVVAGSGSNTGGSVTTKIAVSTTRKLTIYREVPIVQQSKFIKNGPMPAEMVERTLDKLTMICQQLSRKVARAFRFSDTGPALNPVIPYGAGANSVMVVGEDGGFHFWSIKRLQEEIAMMAAVPPMLQALMVQYPVGCLYFTLRPENPRDTLGFGEWRRYGSGRMIVSLDPDNEMFAQVGAMGGEVDVTLSGAQMPTHVHSVQARQTEEGGEHAHETEPTTVTTNPGGGHEHQIGVRLSAGGSGVGAFMTGNAGANADRTTNDGSGEHAHEFNLPAMPVKEGGEHMHEIPEHETLEAGGSEPHNNMPPYIVAHVWTRINSDAPEEGVGTLPFPADPTLFVDRVTGETRRMVVDDTVIGTVPVGGEEPN